MCQASRGYKTFATARNVDKMAGLKEAGCTLLQLDVNDQASVDKARDEVLGQIAKDASLTVVKCALIRLGTRLNRIATRASATASPSLTSTSRRRSVVTTRTSGPSSVSARRSRRTWSPLVTAR